MKATDPQPITSPSWTPERVATLRLRWEGGVAVTLIAQELGVSSSTIVGKAARLALAMRERGPGNDERRAVRLGAEAKTPRPPATPLPAIRKCRFPLWGDQERPTHQYCGERTVEGSAYCPEHHKRCYVRRGSIDEPKLFNFTPGMPGKRVA